MPLKGLNKMVIKKSELYASLWKSCDELRGGMDASQYKDYVLVLLFMKYVSDKAASRPDYDLIVPAGGSFADMVALKGKADIGDGINKVIAKLAEANDTLRGAIDVADFNDDDKLGKGQEKVDRLSNLVAIFESAALDFRGNSAQGDDLLGDAYEYLIRNFATESGKSKGQFYTPAEVSRILAAVVGVTKANSRDQSIYDPTCGSGSLLLKAHDAAQSATGFDLAIYGQEMDNATAALARMNMVLHDATTAEIWQDNTLAHPYFRGGGGLKTFDYVVANPPFSTKSWMNGFDSAHDAFDRFRYGMPPPRNGDYAFILHMLASLKSTGRAAIILSNGVLFRGNQEALIRRELVRQGFIEAIIGLPGNLFYGTSISACILVLDKAGAANRTGAFVIDASKGFVKDGNKNRLRERDIHRMVDAFDRRTEVTGYSTFVSNETLAANDFNLNVARYIDSNEPPDTQDITGHLIGGIPDADVQALDNYWRVFPSLLSAVMQPFETPGYWQLCVNPSDVGGTINGHPEVHAFQRRVLDMFETWAQTQMELLRSFDRGSHPKQAIENLGETLLDCYRGVPLMDPYAVYQRLMDYSGLVLQDDLHLIADAGWLGAAKPRQIDSQRKGESPDYVLGKQRFKSDLLPASVVVGRFFAAGRAAIEDLETNLARIDQRLTDLTEEHGVEGGLLEDIAADNGRPTKAALQARMKATAGDRDADEERAVLRECLEVVAAQAETRATLSAATDALNKDIALKYVDLSRDEILSLVVDDKWAAQLRRDVEAEMARVSQMLTSRLTSLGDRYAVPLQRLTEVANAAAARVEEHLRRMGVS